MPRRRAVKQEPKETIVPVKEKRYVQPEVVEPVVVKAEKTKSAEKFKKGDRTLIGGRAVKITAIEEFGKGEKFPAVGKKKEVKTSALAGSLLIHYRVEETRQKTCALIKSSDRLAVL